MNYYVVSSTEHPIDGALQPMFQSLDPAPIELELPNTHGELAHLFDGRSGGIVFLPAVWEDLYSVKLVEELDKLAAPFESIVIGSAPSASNLALLFNEGVGGFVETPLETALFRIVLRRVTERYHFRCEQLKRDRRLAQLESGAPSSALRERDSERDRFLGTALTDFYKRQGPIFDGDCRVLVVASSTAQRNRLEKGLMGLGIITVGVGSMAQALATEGLAGYTLIIADRELPDGDALELAQRLRRSKLSALPRLIVWSSSPEKVDELLRPGANIDDVILKPPPSGGIEAVLPPIIENIYQI